MCYQAVEHLGFPRHISEMKKGKEEWHNNDDDDNNKSRTKRRAWDESDIKIINNLEQEKREYTNKKSMENSAKRDQLLKKQQKQHEQEQEQKGFGQKCIRKNRFLTLWIHVAWAVGTLPRVKLLQDDCKTVNVTFLGPSGRTIWETKNLGCNP